MSRSKNTLAKRLARAREASSEPERRARIREIVGEPGRHSNLVEKAARICQQAGDLQAALYVLEIREERLLKQAEGYQWIQLANFYASMGALEEAMQQEEYGDADKEFLLSLTCFQQRHDLWRTLAREILGRASAENPGLLGIFHKLDVSP